MTALALLLLLVLPVMAVIVLVYIRYITRQADLPAEEEDPEAYARYQDRSMYYYLQSSRNGDLLREEELIKNNFGTESSEEEKPYRPGSG